MSLIKEVWRSKGVRGMLVGFLAVASAANNIYLASDLYSSARGSRSSLDNPVPADALQINPPSMSGLVKERLEGDGIILATFTGMCLLQLAERRDEPEAFAYEDEFEPSYETAGS